MRSNGAQTRQQVRSAPARQSPTLPSQSPHAATPLRFLYRGAALALPIHAEQDVEEVEEAMLVAFGIPMGQIVGIFEPQKQIVRTEVQKEGNGMKRTTTRSDCLLLAPALRFSPSAL
jgi:hypothetical protein